MPEWYEQDEFWEALEGWLFDEERLSETPREVSDAIGLLGLEPRARVLDLCCGPGRHSIELARRGYRVVGVDRTARYLEAARRRAAEEGLSIEFVEQDMRAFRREQAFDAAINLLTSFGYFRDPEDDRTVLSNLYASLKPGGRLVIQLTSKEIVARIFAPRDWRTLPGGNFFLEERKILSGWELIQNHWVFIRGAERQEFTFTHRLYSGTELAESLHRAGFESVSLYGSLARRPYDESAEALVAVAEKGGPRHE
jgi:SAM-dependent methyltransferase